MEFHERLRELRRQAGLSLRQLAQSTNYSRSYLSELETGIKRPPPETAERLDEALSAGGGLLALARRRSDGDAPLLDDPEHIDQRRRRTGSPHRVRLAVNGEARALARLGDPYGVDEAVDRAFTTLGEYRDGGDVSVSMTLGAYCFTRVNANAATAYLSLGRAVEVERYGVPALAAFDQAELRGPQALTRLDLATAALGSPDPDPDRASQLAVEALKV